MRRTFIFPPLFFTLALFMTGCSKSDSSSFPVAYSGVYSASFSENGSHVVIGSHQDGGSYWQLSPPERIFNWNHATGEQSKILVTDIARNGSKAITASENKLVVWDTKTGKSLNYLQTSSDILSAELNEDGSRVLLGLDNGAVWYTNTRTGDNLHEFKHDAQVRSVALNETKKLAISGGDDFEARIWSLETGKLLHATKTKNMIRLVRLANNGHYGFVSSSRSEHLVIDTNTFKPIANIQARYANFNDAFFSDKDDSITLITPQGYVRRYSLDGVEQKNWRASSKHLWGSSRALIAVHASNTKTTVISADGRALTFTP